MRLGNGHGTGARWAWVLGLLAVSLGVLAGSGWRPRAGTAALRPRIMPLGDSLTQGTAEYPGYRVILWRQLREQGLQVDFVGSARNYFMRRWGPWGFDGDHEGHWGWSAAQLRHHLGPWARRARPDIVLLHAGVNDLFGGRTPEAIVADLETIVHYLRRTNPRVAVLVAQLPATLDDQSGPHVVELNQRIAELGLRLNTEASPVVVVDQFSGFDPQTDTYDGLHPNARGAEKMAARWMAALGPVLRGAGAEPIDPGGGRGNQ